MRLLLDFHMGRRGERKYVQVLGLPEAFTQQKEAEVVKGSHRMGAISFDAVKHPVLCGQPHLNLELYPYLPRGQGRHHFRQGLHGVDSGRGQDRMLREMRPLSVR